MKRFVLCLAALTLLTACGVKGDLERPNPMWNAPAAIRHDCRRQREYNETHPGHQVPLDRRCTPEDGQPPAPSPTQPQ